MIRQQFPEKTGKKYSCGTYDNHGFYFFQFRIHVLIPRSVIDL